MILTDFQKTIVQDILSGNVSEMESFIKRHIKVQSDTNKTGNYFSLTSNGSYSVQPNGKFFKAMDDDEALSQVRQFFILWNQLEKANLIYSLPIDKWSLFPLFKQDGKPHTKALHIIERFNTKEIIFFPELSDFVKNNFLTFEEMKVADEAADRKKTLRLTRQLAYISIIISIILAAVTVITNYLTYTTERTVTIKNPSAFADTTRVLILNQEKPLNQKPDSGKVLKK